MSGAPAFEALHRTGFHDFDSDEGPANFNFALGGHSVGRGQWALNPYCPKAIGHRTDLTSFNVLRRAAANIRNYTTHFRTGSPLISPPIGQPVETPPDQRFQSDGLHLRFSLSW